MRKFFLQNAFAAFILVANLSAQTSSPSTEKFVGVSVITTNNLVVTDLTGSHFTVYEGKKTRPISTFVSDDGPASICIVVDVSGSMNGLDNRYKKHLGIKTTAEALRHFIAKGDPKNEYLILTVGPDIGDPNSFTSDSIALEAALKSLEKIENKGTTRLYDALQVAFRMLGDAKYQKKMLVLVSDGVDNESSVKFAAVRLIARMAAVCFFNVRPEIRSSPVVYPPVTTTSMDTEGELKMQELAKTTGGRVYTYDSSDTLKYDLDMIGLLLKQRYRIGIDVSAGTKENTDQWRKIKIRLQHPNKDFAKQLVVLAPEGYYID